MTKETKIGLLVGLAFIIVFAVILSEKGPSARTSTLPAFTLADGSKTVGPIAPSSQPLNNAGRLPVDSHLPPIVQPSIGVNPRLPMREEEVVQPIQVAEAELPPLPDSVVSLINGTLPVEQPPETLIATGSPTIAAPFDQENRAIEAPIPVESTTPSGSPTILAATDATAPTVLPASAQTRFLTIKTVHTVEKGESLGKIAAKYYERSSPARVDAIFQANRDLLDDHHNVRAGQRIKIPDLGTAGGDFEAAPDFAFGNEVRESPSRELARSTPAQPTAHPSTPQKDALIRIPIPIPEKTGMEADGRLVRSDDSIGREFAISRPQDTRSTRSTDVSFRLYEVKPSDTLSGIARRELGSERYHTEIYKLNKDILVDKNTIKPGMKLRLPIPSALATESRTALSSSGLGTGD